MDFTHVKYERNLIADTMVFVRTRKWTPDYDPHRTISDTRHEYGLA
jgi:hypothetical protein